MQHFIANASIVLGIIENCRQSLEFFTYGDHETVHDDQ